MNPYFSVNHPDRIEIWHQPANESAYLYAVLHFVPLSRRVVDTAKDAERLVELLNKHTT